MRASNSACVLIKHSPNIWWKCDSLMKETCLFCEKIIKKLRKINRLSKFHFGNIKPSFKQGISSIIKVEKVKKP